MAGWVSSARTLQSGHSDCTRAHKPPVAPATQQCGAAACAPALMPTALSKLEVASEWLSHPVMWVGTATSWYGLRARTGRGGR